VHASFVDNPILNAVDIPRELDPRLVDGARTQQQRLARLSPTNVPHWCSNATPSCELSQAATGDA
jgi:hypothetical protein